MRRAKLQQADFRPAATALPEVPDAPEVTERRRMEMELADIEEQQFKLRQRALTLRLRLNR